MENRLFQTLATTNACMPTNRIQCQTNDTEHVATLFRTFSCFISTWHSGGPRREAAAHGVFRTHSGPDPHIVSRQCPGGTKRLEGRWGWTEGRPSLQEGQPSPSRASVPLPLRPPPQGTCCSQPEPRCLCGPPHTESPAYAQLSFDLAHPRPQGCIRREGTSEAAPEVVRQAVGGQSGWGGY